MSSRLLYLYTLLFNNIDAEFVYRHSGGLYLYCAVHRTFHSKDDFSTGNRGMQRTAVRYCLETTAAEREDFDNLANMTPTVEGRRRGAELLKLTLHPDDRAPEAVESSRSARRSSARLGWRSSYRSGESAATLTRSLFGFSFAPECMLF